MNMRRMGLAGAVVLALCSAVFVPGGVVGARAEGAPSGRTYSLPTRADLEDQIRFQSNQVAQLTREISQIEAQLQGMPAGTQRTNLERDKASSVATKAAEQATLNRLQSDLSTGQYQKPGDPVERPVDLSPPVILNPHGVDLQMGGSKPSTPATTPTAPGKPKPLPAVTPTSPAPSSPAPAAPGVSTAPTPPVAPPSAGMSLAEAALTGRFASWMTMRAQIYALDNKGRELAWQAQSDAQPDVAAWQSVKLTYNAIVSKDDSKATMARLKQQATESAQGLAGVQNAMSMAADTISRCEAAGHVPKECKAALVLVQTAAQQAEKMRKIGAEAPIDSEYLAQRAQQVQVMREQVDKARPVLLAFVGSKEKVTTGVAAAKQVLADRTALVQSYRTMRTDLLGMCDSLAASDPGKAGSWRTKIEDNVTPSETVSWSQDMGYATDTFDKQAKGITESLATVDGALDRMKAITPMEAETGEISGNAVLALAALNDAPGLAARALQCLTAKPPVTTASVPPATTTPGPTPPATTEPTTPPETPPPPMPPGEPNVPPAGPEPTVYTYAYICANCDYRWGGSCLTPQTVAECPKCRKTATNLMNNEPATPTGTTPPGGTPGGGTTLGGYANNNQSSSQNNATAGQQNQQLTQDGNTAANAGNPQVTQGQNTGSAAGANANSALNTSAGNTAQDDHNNSAGTVVGTGALTGFGTGLGNAATVLGSSMGQHIVNTVFGKPPEVVVPLAGGGTGGTGATGGGGSGSGGSGGGSGGGGSGGGHGGSTGGTHGGSGGGPGGQGTNAPPMDGGTKDPPPGGGATNAPATPQPQTQTSGSFTARLNPSGSSYTISVSGVATHSLSATVSGTDGYSNSFSGTGSISSSTIPAGASGVHDTVVCKDNDTGETATFTFNF